MTGLYTDNLPSKLNAVTFDFKADESQDSGGRKVMGDFWNPTLDGYASPCTLQYLTDSVIIESSLLFFGRLVVFPSHHQLPLLPLSHTSFTP